MDEVIPIVVRQIINTAQRLNCDRAIPIDRLSYELTQDEWREFGKYVEQFQFVPDVPVMGAIYSAQFMGLRVWRKSQDGDRSDG